MVRKIIVPGELSLASGLLLISLAVTLMVHADFGISTISAVPYTLSCVFNEVSFGVWNMVFQICLLVILILTTKKARSGYVISLVITVSFGLILDAYAGAFSSLPSGIWFRLLYITAGYLIMCVAISLMIGSRVPLMIVDSFINDLTKHYHTTFRRMKTLIDIAFVTMSVLLSVAFLGALAGVGVGTIVMAIITGSGVHAASRFMGRWIVIEPWNERLGRMAK